MPRLRSYGLVAVFGAGVVLAAALAGRGYAQAPTNPLTDGMRPSIDAEPGPLATSRRARNRRGRAAPERAGQGPRYGHRPGFGAGDVGYVSTNVSAAAAGLRRSLAPRAKRPRGARHNADPAPAALSRARPGGGNTGPSRPGAAIDLPAGTATPLVRRRPPAQDDAFEQLGLRTGGLILRPAIETTAGYDSNAERTRGGRASSFVTLAPELQLRSDWRRHAVSADLRGAYTAYERLPALDRPYLDARAHGRLDITSHLRADIEGRAAVSTDNPGSPDLPAGLARLPAFTTLGGSAGVTRRFNRLEVGLKGSVDRVAYEDSTLTDGSVVSNRDRNYNQYAAHLRATYEVTPGLKPFIEGGVDTRIRDLAVDSFGLRRDSQGATARAGASVELSSKLTGEISVGYLLRTYKDPVLPDLTGLIVDGSLVWAASGLTTVKLTAKSSADESTLPGVAGVLRRDLGLQVDHAFRRWLIGAARVGYGADLYKGATREDTRYVAALALTYKLSRSVQFKGELRQEWLRSNVPGNDYTASVALVGLRLQR